MRILVVGATGATGRLLVEQLLNRGHHVRAVVRDSAKLPDELQINEQLSIIEASLLELSDAELARTVEGCRAVASCLGHNMSWKGIYGQPRRLVTDAVRRLCKAVKVNQPATLTRFVLMNTAGNSNRDIGEPISFSQQIVIGLLRLLLPPHVDNEQAADYLRTEIGQTDEAIEWTVVRPDNLSDEDSVTEYSIYPSPIRSAIFDAGATSRINVAHFMADLVSDDDIWLMWKGKMPVIYNKTSAQL
jgi:nucleoside-diphosphate-sugar epimerase